MLGLGNSLTVHPHGWSPSEIPSLLHWYRFDTGITKDAQDDVTEWADQKGSNDATSDGVAANSPLYSSGAVVFNATGDILTFGSALSLGAFSIYIRMESDDLGSAADETLIENGSNIFLRISHPSQIRIKWDGERNDYTLDPVLSVDTKFNLGVERASDGDIEMYINGSTDSVTKAGGNNHNIATSAAFTPARMGQPAVTSKYYEVIICSDSLNASDRSNLNTYLNLI